MTGSETGTQAEASAGASSRWQRNKARARDLYGKTKQPKVLLIGGGGAAIVTAGLGLWDISKFAAVAGGAAACWEAYKNFRKEPEKESRTTAPHPSPGAAPSALLTLPPGPSVAVLPFQNLSQDTNQDYFVDGVTEELTSALSRISWLFVIARNSAFTFKGRPVDVRQAGRELGVRYIVEGSVQRSGARVRIAAHLVNAQTGQQVWADRFESEGSDLFALQDSVTEAIAGAIEPSLRLAEIAKARAKRPSSLDTHEQYFLALSHIRELTREGSSKALELLRAVIQADPGFVTAKALAIFCLVTRAAQGWQSPEDTREGIELSRSALSEGDDDAYALSKGAQGLAFFAQDYDTGYLAIERSLKISPNSNQVIVGAAHFFLYRCEPARALELLHRAIRRSPLDPQLGWIMGGVASAHLMNGSYQEALEWAKNALDRAPKYGPAHRAKIVALWMLGRHDAAHTAASAFLDLVPGTSIGPRSKLYRDKAFGKLYTDALRSAGLPD